MRSVREVSLLAFAACAAGFAVACGAQQDSRGGPVPGDGGADAGPADGSSGDGGGDECEGVDFPMAGRPPRALVVLDRSSSMAMGAPTPWEVTVEALVAITAELDFRIEFGLLLYPAVDEPCAPPPPTPDVPIAPSAGADIAAVLGASGPDGQGTPTTEALSRAFEHLVGLSGDEERFAILATDGAPNCSANPSYSCETCVWTADACFSTLACLDDVGLYSVVTEYHDSWGIDTYVIGLGGVWDAWDDVLSHAADYGGTGDYFPAQTDEGPAGLIAALQAIAAENTVCVFDVDWAALGPDVSQDPALVNLVVEGETVPFSADCANEGGWRWADEDTIELCPGLCEDYRWGVVSSVHASFGCETFVE